MNTKFLSSVMSNGRVVLGKVTNKSIFSALILLGAGCSLLKASQLLSSGFVPYPERLAERRERAPFGGYWESENFRDQQYLGKYNALYIAPISLKKIEADLKKKKNMPKKYRRDRIEEFKELGRYFNERLKRNATENQNLHLKVVDKRGANTLELAIEWVEISPTEPFINTAGTVAGYFFRGTGLIKRFGQGKVAIEGYLKDSQTNEVFMEFTDRESDKTTFFTLKDFQQYAHIREAVDDWSRQLIELFSTDSKHQVPDSWPVSLSPY